MKLFTKLSIQVSIGIFFAVFAAMLPASSVSAQSTEQTREELLLILVDLLSQLLVLQERVAALTVNPGVSIGPAITAPTGAGITAPTGVGNLETRVSRGTPVTTREGEVDDFEISRGSFVREGDRHRQFATITFTVREAPVELRRLDIVFDPQTPDIEDDPWDVFERIFIEHNRDTLLRHETGERDDWQRGDFDDDGEDEFRLRLNVANRVFARGTQRLTLYADITSGSVHDEQRWDVSVDKDNGGTARFLDVGGVTFSVDAADERATVTVGEE